MNSRITKLFLFVLLIFLNSCENIPNNIIETKSADYVIESISAPDQFIYSTSNSVLRVIVLITNSGTVNNIWFNVETIDGAEDISNNNIMESPDKTGNRTYAGETTLSEDLLSGTYLINIYIEDNINPSGENVKKVGSKKFIFQSKAVNLPPVISDLKIPAQVNRGDNFVFSIKVQDPNGLIDIKEVYFELRRPDSTIVYADNNNTITEFPLFDNGDLTNAGDDVKGDGIFSLINSFGESSQVGDWYFRFGAIDKSGLKSNTINFSLKVN